MLSNCPFGSGLQSPNGNNFNKWNTSISGNVYQPCTCPVLDSNAAPEEENTVDPSTTYGWTAQVHIYTDFFFQ